MATIHKTTLTPTKLELLAAWLPAQPWYGGNGNGRGPELRKAGGFRLDDPEGEVGIEFMVATDEAADGSATAYHLPLTYRAAPLADADEALIGTSEHGVLGRRWVYDGTHDPVLVAELLALLQGRATPQAQSVSDTPDPSVTSHFTGEGVSTAVGSRVVANEPHGTDIAVETTAGPLTIHVTRVLPPDDATGTTGEARGHVTAGWRSPDGGEHRARFAVLSDEG
jgi:maltokinase-like protein